MTVNPIQFARAKRKSAANIAGCAGFTMIDMLIAVALLSIMFGVIYKGFANINRSFTKENVKAGIQQSARIGVEFMVHDIRLAGLNPLGTADAGIQADPLPTDTSLEFTADTNFDGDVEDPFELIRYELNGNTLEQTNHLGTETLLGNVEDLTFDYLDSHDNMITVDSVAKVDEIRSIRISLTLRRPAGADNIIERNYTTQVRCRNL